MLKKTVISLSFAFLTAVLNAQVYDTANVITPGTLNTVAKAYLTTVTNLTVTGTIDARDFKTMRDSMPLSVLNLSGATIAAYTGEYGTQDPSINTYLANVIPQYAFYDQITSVGKSNLTSIIYPTNVNSIGEDAFVGCNGLTGSLTIPSSVTSIGVAAFGNCSGFTGLTIPSSVTSIGASVFSGCSGLTGSLTIPSSVTSIGWEAFYDCSGLTGLTIPSSVTYIGESAFFGCSGLIGSLTIPSSVTYIGEAAFEECEGFTSIISLNTTPLTGNGMGSYAFYGESKVSLYVPYGSVNAYKTAPQWNSFNVVAFVSISASADTVKSGTSVTFMADTGLIGIHQKLVWQVNGKNMGLNASTFSYIPVDGDTVICKTIIYNDTAKSNAIVMSVEPGTTVLSVSSNNLNVSNALNSQTSFTIYSNFKWNISSKDKWLTPNISNGYDTAIITLTALTNPTNTIRLAKVIVSEIGVPNDTLFVTQAAGQATLSVSKDTLDISAFTNNNRSFNVYSNESWTVTTSKTQTWLTLSVTSGSDSTSISLTAAVNPTINQRIDTIVLSAAGVNSDTIIISQSAWVPTLSVSTNILNVSDTDKSFANFNIHSNVSWNIKNIHPWITPNISSRFRYC